MRGGGGAEGRWWIWKRAFGFGFVAGFTICGCLWPGLRKVTTHWNTGTLGTNQQSRSEANMLKFIFWAGNVLYTFYSWFLITNHCWFNSVWLVLCTCNANHTKPLASHIFCFQDVRHSHLTPTVHQTYQDVIKFTRFLHKQPTWHDGRIVNDNKGPLSLITKQYFGKLKTFTFSGCNLKDMATKISWNL